MAMDWADFILVLESGQWLIRGMIISIKIRIEGICSKGNGIEYIPLSSSRLI